MRAMASRSWLTARMAVPVNVRVRKKYSAIIARIASTKAMNPTQNQMFVATIAEPRAVSRIHDGRATTARAVS